jgi:hypothetical protein
VVPEPPIPNPHLSLLRYPFPSIPSTPSTQHSSTHPIIHPTPSPIPSSSQFVASFLHTLSPTLKQNFFSLTINFLNPPAHRFESLRFPILLPGKPASRLIPIQPSLAPASPRPIITYPPNSSSPFFDSLSSTLPPLSIPFKSVSSKTSSVFAYCPSGLVASPHVVDPYNVLQTLRLIFFLRSLRKFIPPSP